MSDDKQAVETGRSSVQVYSFSVICLLIGLCVGYLFTGSIAPSPAGTSANLAVQTQVPQANTAAPAQPSPDDKKRMAQKQVAPLLEQLKTNPKNADTLAKVGHYYMLAAQYDDAATYYERSAEVRPTPAVYTTLAGAQVYGGHPDKAIETLNHALRLDPQYADALFGLGVLKWRAKGDTKGAIACWETLAKTNPNHPQLDQVKKLIAQIKEQGAAPHTLVTP